MIMRTRLVMIVLVGLCGCAVAEAPTPSPSVTVTGTSTSAGETAAAARSSTGPLSDVPVPLAEFLPRELDGVELHTFAVGQAMTERLAASLDVDPDVLELAYASEHGARFFQTYAIRLPDVDGDALLNAFAGSAYDPAEGDVTTSEAVIGEKRVMVVTQPSTAARIGSYYAYTLDATLLIVQTLDPEVAADVLSALP